MNFHIGQIVEVWDGQSALPPYSISELTGLTFSLKNRDGTEPDRMTARPLKELVEVHEPGKPIRVLWNHD